MRNWDAFLGFVLRASGVGLVFLMLVSFVFLSAMGGKLSADLFFGGATWVLAIGGFSVIAIAARELKDPEESAPKRQARTVLLPTPEKPEMPELVSHLSRNQITIERR